MIRLFRNSLCVIVVLVSAAPAGVLAQDPNTPAASEATVTADEVTPAAETPIYSGIQTAQAGQIGQPPRTLRAYWHVFIAFAVTWLLLFGYALSLGRRWAALERQLQQDLSER